MIDAIDVTVKIPREKLADLYDSVTRLWPRASDYIEYRKCDQCGRSVIEPHRIYCLDCRSQLQSKTEKNRMYSKESRLRRKGLL